MAAPPEHPADQRGSRPLGEVHIDVMPSAQHGISSARWNHFLQGSKTGQPAVGFQQNHKLSCYAKRTIAHTCSVGGCGTIASFQSPWIESASNRIGLISGQIHLISQQRSNVRVLQASLASQERLWGFPGDEIVQNGRHHHSCALDAWFVVANQRLRLFSKTFV